MADGANKLMTRVTTGLGFVAAAARGAEKPSLPSCFLPALHPLQSDRAQSGAAPILSGAAARHLLELFRLQLEDDNARRKADWIKDDWHSILN